MKYLLGWDAGATAEIELRMPREGGSSFGLRYKSAYRSTLRSPIEALRVGPGALDQSKRRLQQLVSSLQLVPGRGPGGGGGSVVAASRTLQDIGLDLYELVLPPHVQADLRDPLFIELAVDEEMLAFPWELMFDGEQFLGHKHAIGRYVNLLQPLLTQVSRPHGVGTELGEVKVLVVGVPRPTTEGDIEELTAVEPEVEAITDTLTGLGIHPTVLMGRNADYDSVRAELRKEYHIIHFSGHATFNDRAPNRSALLLYDARIETGAVMAFFSRHPAILCFINACESTRTAPPEGDGDGGARAAAPEEELSWETRYNNYGLARAFLETGTYLLGSRWRLEDEPAKVFARTFYEAALGRGEPIGRAIALARAETADRSPPEGCAWASYVYYGDPRVSFRPEAEARLAALPAAPGPGPRQMLEELADAYEQTRASQLSGWARTREMTRIAQEASRLAGSVDPAAVVRNLFGHSDGGRIVALALLKERADPAYFDLLMDAITGSRSAFEQYIALEGMRPLTPLLDAQQAAQLRDAVAQLSEDEDFFGSDRYVLANQIATQLAGASPPVLA